MSMVNITCGLSLFKTEVPSFKLPKLNTNILKMIVEKSRAKAGKNNLFLFLLENRFTSVSSNSRTNSSRGVSLSVLASAAL